MTADQRIEGRYYEKIKNISHVGIAEHMKQLKNAELPEHARNGRNNFRNEWK